MQQGLPRKLRYAFFLQAIMASVAIVIGIYAAGMVVKDLLAVQRMRSEAAGYWSARARDPNAPLPTSTNIQGYFVPANGNMQALPPSLRSLRPGIVELTQSKRKVLVD